MSGFAPKDYQRRVLASVQAYFEACTALGNANTAFYQLTGELWGRHQPFNPLPGFAPENRDCGRSIRNEIGFV